LIFTFFNLLVFLPCCLVIRVLARVRRVRVLPLVGLFAMNPAVMQNATYTWTKLLTAFFVILALSLYLSAWRKRDSRRMVAAFVALAAGLLVHYSAGPYVVFFAVHYLLVVFRTRRQVERAARHRGCQRATAIHLVWLVHGGIRVEGYVRLEHVDHRQPAVRGQQRG